MMASMVRHDFMLRLFLPHGVMDWPSRHEDY